MGGLALSYAWVLLMPVVPSVSGAGMMRFNLLADSFGSWALQQTIPSIYNFSNQADFGPVHLEPRLPYLEMNHYPPRLFTFLERDDHTEALPMILKTRSGLSRKSDRSLSFDRGSARWDEDDSHAALRVR